MESSVLPSGVEEVRGSGTWERDEWVRHARSIMGQVFQLNALSSSDESLNQLLG